MNRQTQKAARTANVARNDLREVRAYLCHGPGTPRYLKKVARRADRRAARVEIRSAS